MATFIKNFSDYDTAFEYMQQRNRASAKAGNHKDILCVVPSAFDGYAVVDHLTAIELGLGYVFSSSSTGWVCNPWPNN